MHRHKGCTRFIHGVLDTIEENMLVVNGKDANDRRASADFLWPIFKQFSSLSDDCYIAQATLSGVHEEDVAETGVIVELAPELIPYMRNEPEREEVEFDSENSDDSENASVTSSGFSDISALSSNSSLSNSDRFAIRELAGFLQQDVVLVSMFPKVFSALGPDDFERKVAKLLARYSRNLKKEATPGPQYQTSSFVGRSRLQVARLIKNHMIPVDDRRPTTQEEDTWTDDRAQLNERIALQSRPHHGPTVFAAHIDVPSEVVQHVEDVRNTEFDGNESDDSQSSEGISDPPFDALREVKEFLEYMKATLKMVNVRSWSKSWKSVKNWNSSKTQKSQTSQTSQSSQRSQKAKKA
ncbi:uncharacterized protein PG986_008453 [Apiospora aurea]|uniref:Uncharacterized protein n=1 Tax=Apiospora aurea TaxID=335848 RepID=A0ABR1QGX1_9PEZI